MTGTNINNLGSIERVIRLFLGCSLIGAVMVTPFPIENLVLMPLIGIYPCLTAIFGWDPAYYVFGINKIQISELVTDKLLPQSQVEILKPRFI